MQNHELLARQSPAYFGSAELRLCVNPVAPALVPIFERNNSPLAQLLKKRSGFRLANHLLLGTRAALATGTIAL
jgi:hypothetical protein